MRADSSWLLLAWKSFCVLLACPEKLIKGEYLPPPRNCHCYSSCVPVIGKDASQTACRHVNQPQVREGKGHSPPNDGLRSLEISTTDPTSADGLWRYWAGSRLVKLGKTRVITKYPRSTPTIVLRRCHLAVFVPEHDLPFLVVPMLLHKCPPSRAFGGISSE